MLIVFIRATILYGLIMFCIRLMGKRQLGELQPSELVITILLSNIASLPIEDTSIPLILGAVPLLVLVGCELIVSNISLKSKKFRSFVSGSPVIVIRKGVIDQNELRNLRFSIDDLMEIIRQNSIFDIRDVEYAIVETTGKISILPKFKAQAVTADMLGLESSEDVPPVVVISDGELLQSAVRACNLDNEWVFQTVAKHNCAIKDVFLLTCDNTKDYHLVEKNYTK